MRTIELAGPIGAGKSSAEGPLREILAELGIDVLTLAEARRRVSASRLRRLASSVTFAARHPSLMVLVIGSLVQAPIGGWHRRHIAGLVVRLGAELGLLADELPSASVVILDEGWLHRSVNVFAWRDELPTNRELTSYLDRAPLSPLVLVIDAPEAVLRDRLAARGLPKRLRGRATGEIDAFLRRSRQILVQAAGVLDASGGTTRVVNVCNDGSALELRARLLAAIGGPGPMTNAPIHRQAWPSLPRPDRVVQRALRRSRSVSIDSDEIAMAVAHFELPQPVHAKPPTSPGGRGRVATLRDGDSREWLLKRYKPSLGDDEIASEHEVLARLAELGRSTPRLRLAADGTTVLHAAGGRFAMFERAVGYAHPHERVLAPGDRRRMEREAGATLADLHQSLAAFEPSFPSRNGFEGRRGPRVLGLERIRALIAKARASPVATALPADRIEAELRRLDELLAREDPPRTVIHGDYGPYNLLLRDGHPPFVLDFELARIDWRLTDLAAALPRFSERRLGFQHGAAARFVEGYRSVSALPPDELRLLPSVAQYLGLRRAVVCWDRFRATGDRAWLVAARERFSFAERVAAGRQPLSRVG